MVCLLESAAGGRQHTSGERRMTALLDIAEVSKLFPVGGGPGAWARLKRRVTGGSSNCRKCMPSTT